MHSFSRLYKQRSLPLLTNQASGLPFDQANLSLVCWKFILTKIREKNEKHLFLTYIFLLRPTLFVILSHHTFCIYLLRVQSS